MASHGHKSSRKRRRRSPVGSVPGLIVEAPSGAKCEMTVAIYGPSGIENRRLGSNHEIPSLPRQDHIVWIDFEGTPNAVTFKLIGQTFGIHGLALEDIASQHLRAKVETYGATGFIVLPHIRWDNGPQTEPFSVLFGKSFVLSFHSAPAPFLNPVRERLVAGTGSIRTSGSDYLAYALMDALVDDAFPALDACADMVDQIEHEIAASPLSASLSRIHEIRRNLLVLHRTVWPMRDAFNDIVWECKELFTEGTRVYLRDCADHVHQLIDAVEAMRDSAAGLVELQISSSGNRMNEVIKVLTIISTIFIPLNFIVGLYGMNFHHMPELDWPWGYPMVIGILLAVSGGMLWFFRRRGWMD